MDVTKAYMMFIVYVFVDFLSTLELEERRMVIPMMQEYIFSRMNHETLELFNKEIKDM